MMANRTRDRSKHINGIRYPHDWAHGTCRSGHDITLEHNIGIEARGEYGLYGMRCQACRRETRSLTHNTRLREHNWATAVKTCAYCGLEFRPGQRDTTRNSWNTWEKRRYCGTACSSRGAKVGEKFQHIHARVRRPSDGWQDHAACYGAHNIDFYPDHETAGTRSEIEAHERSIINTFCARCPVRMECLNESLARRDYYGVQGGMRGVDRETYRPPRQVNT
jgi:hypothetical protein